MAKKVNAPSAFEGFDDLMGENKDSVAMALDSLDGKDKEKVKRATRGAAAGCKPGSSRHTYVLPDVMIQKIKAISGYFGKPEVAIVLDILEKGIAEYEEQYGPQVSDLSRGRGL